MDDYKFLMKYSKQYITQIRKKNKYNKRFKNNSESEHIHS